MDNDLSGTEMPGAILDYVKESNQKEKPENKEIDLKEIKKEIFKTFENAKRILTIENDEDFESKQIQILQYDDSINQKIYETIRLSDPSKSKPFYTKLATKKKIDYIGPITDVKTKENFEPNQFIVELGNGIKATIDKRYLRNKEYKNKKIEELVEYFENAKNKNMLLINLKLIEYYIGQKLIREPIIIDYHEWDPWKKYKNLVLEKKEKYKLTFYEYFISGILGLNPFDLEGKEKELFDSLYIPRILILYPVKTPILPNEMVPYTHIMQFTPAATGKTQFVFAIKNYFNVDYYDKIPTRAKGIYHAQLDIPGAVYKHDYIFIDEFTKKDTQKIQEFMDNYSTGLSSGEWVVEKGSDKNKGFYKPVGFGIFGNILGSDELIVMQKMDSYYEGIDYKRFENAREAARFILYKGLKDPEYRANINTLIDRFAIVSIVLKSMNIPLLGVLNLAPNPLELYALKDLIQERIKEIAKEPNKYIDIEKIKKEKWEDGRLYSNAIKIAIKLIAFEIDKYLGKSAEDLAIEMVKGYWNWKPE
ncbi:MAG: hypothetical protein RXQ77_03770 [Candidatus Nanopusillus sp.]